MPIYEFSCQACGHEFEKIVSFSATTMPTCPACQSNEVGRHMSRPAIHFKGSGWYITDSRKGNGKKSETASASGGTKGDEAAKSSESGDNAGSSKAGESAKSTEPAKTDSAPVKAAAD